MQHVHWAIPSGVNGLRGFQKLGGNLGYLKKTVVALHLVAFV
jgi:hypothetical protein